MTRKDIIRMAREAGIVVTGEAVWKLCELVADAEAKRMHDEGMVTVGHMRQQIAAEREAILQMSAATWFKTQADYDAAIRARGQA
jgi:hypothetical protein